VSEQEAQLFTRIDISRERRKDFVACGASGTGFTVFFVFIVLVKFTDRERGG
jgi:hypothetical protein